MNTELDNQDERFASRLAAKIIEGESLKQSGLFPKEIDLVIAALREDSDIQFALELTELGSAAEDVSDIGRQRHYMQIALDILDIENAN